MIFFIQAWKVMEFLKVSVIMENKVIWAVLHLQTKPGNREKLHTIKKLFQEKWPNLGYGKMWRVMIEVLEKSWNFQSSIGKTVRDYFKRHCHPSSLQCGNLVYSFD